MRNYNARTFIITLLTVTILLALYFLPVPTIGEHTFRRVNLLSDIEQKEPEIEMVDSVMLPPPIKPAFADTCKTEMTCIEDYADSTQKGMKPFYEALDHVKERPVRIAYFGDSFIEADIMTANLRDMLQQRFGGCGTGFVDITSMTPGFRKSLLHKFDGWKTHSMNDSLGYDRKRIGLSGHYFIPHTNAFVEAHSPKNYLPNLDSCEIATLFFESKGILELTTQINSTESKQQTVNGNGNMQTLSMNGHIKKVRWTVNRSDSTTFYGFALDGHNGIILDNFGVRSSSGLQLRSIPMSRLKQFNEKRSYDLIVLQFGLNVATERGYNYDGYEQGMLRVIDHLKTAFPQAGFLIIGIGDRESKNEDGVLRTMPGVKNLIRYQQNIAAKSGVAFWNLYEAMGGEGSIRRMVEAQPAQANLDYTHINFRGGKVLAEILYETLIYGKEQHDKRKAYENE